MRNRKEDITVYEQAKEEADYIIKEFLGRRHPYLDLVPVKKQAIICVDQIIRSWEEYAWRKEIPGMVHYYNLVKQEIINL